MSGVGAGAAVFAAVIGGVGTTLLLSTIRWFARSSLLERVRPYLATAHGGQRARRAPLTVRGLFGPLVMRLASMPLRLTGQGDSAAERLARIDAEDDVTAFRLRQFGWALVAFAASGALATAVSMPPLIGFGFVLCGPVLAVLSLEHRLAAASRDYRRRLVAELPVVAEQLGMLLGAGYSLGAALARVTARGTGTIPHDLDRVTNRVRQGLSISDALDEWAARAQVPALRRLVQVLALHQTATDLGPLISTEARTIRAEAHQELIAQTEKRAQLVWLPVTVAALVPGAIFLAVPFIDAVRLVTAG